MSLRVSIKPVGKTLVLSIFLCSYYAKSVSAQATDDANAVDVVTNTVNEASQDEIVDQGETVVQGQALDLEDSSIGERTADNIVDKLDVQDIERAGDSSIAGVLKRISGVSVVDGKYAVIRGLKGRYTSSLLNGNMMPSTDPISREVQLDLFPSNILQGIDIQKTYTANLPGDTTGGLVGLTTKDAVFDDLFSASTRLGYRAGTTFDHSVSYLGGSTDFLGYDDGFRSAPNGLVAASDGGLNARACQIEGQSDCIERAELIEFAKDFEPVYTPFEKTAKPDVLLGLSFNKMIDAALPVGLYGAFNYRNEYETRQDGELNDFDLIGTYQRSQQELTLDAYLAAAFEISPDDIIHSKTLYLHKTDDITRLEEGVDMEDNARTEAILQWTERELISQQIVGEHIALLGEEDRVDWTLGFARSNVDQPDRRQYDTQSGNPILSSFERRFYDHSEDGVSLNADYEVPFYLSDTLRSEIKAGVMFSDREREVNLYRFNYRAANGFSPSGSNTLEDILTDSNFDNGNIELRGQTDDTDSFTADSTLSAVYVSGLFDFDSLVTLELGVRQESYEQNTRYPDAVEANASLDESNVLPALNASYSFTEEVQLRAGFSQTVSYPGIVERANSRLYDPRTDILVFGNPDLKTAEIDNFDLRLEYYYREQDSLTLAYFFKDFTNPIERSVPDASGSAVNGITYRNSQSAEVSGFEIEGYSTIKDDGDRQIFFSGNLTFLDSEVMLDEDSMRLEGDQDGRALQGLSDFLVNLQFGYDHYETQQKATLLVNYFDDRIEFVEREARGNFVEEGRWELNVNYEKGFDSGLKLSAKIKNLLDEPVEYSRNGQVVESYKQGQLFQVGVGFDF